MYDKASTLDIIKIVLLFGWIFSAEPIVMLLMGGN